MANSGIGTKATSEPLSIARCRSLLDHPDLSDQEVAELLNGLRSLADVVLDELQRPASLMLEKARRLAPNEDWEAIEERAAIYEYEAEMPRDVSERLAVTDHLERRGPK